MKELFKKQIEENKLVTEEVLNKFNKKDYFNGEPIKVGDNVLFALMIEGGDEIKNTDMFEAPMPMTRENDVAEDKEIRMTIITLNETHFDLFEANNRYMRNINTSVLPTIILKNKQ